MRSIRDGDRVPMNLSGTSSQGPRPAKTEKTVSYHQNMVFKGGGDLASVKQLVHFVHCCFNSRAEQSHEDNARRPTGEEQLIEAKGCPTF